MNDRVMKLALLVGLSILMIPIGLKIGKSLKGGPKVMAELVSTPDSGGRPVAVLVEAELKAVPNARLYVTVQRDGEPWVDRISFADANVMDTPPEFTVYRSEALMALSTRHYPELVLWVCDLDAGTVWPEGARPASDDATQSEMIFDEAMPTMVFVDFDAAEIMLNELIEGGVAPADARLLESGYLPKVNDRLDGEATGTNGSP